MIEALIFVSDEPLSAKTIADVLKEDKEVINDAVAAWRRNSMRETEDYSYAKLRAAGSLRRGPSITSTCARF